MRRRRWIGLVGGVVAARGVPASSLPDTAARAVQQEEQEFPLIIANMPATGQQKAVAVGVAVVLIVTAAVIAPFAHIQLRPIDAFIPVLQTSLFVVDLVTVALLFSQYSIQPQRALLALASGYICSGSFAFLQTLAFPGGYAPAGLIGDGPNSPAWIYVLWHTTFPAAIIVYALSKDAAGAASSGRAAMKAIALHCRLRSCGDSRTDLDRDDESAISPELLHRCQVSDPLGQPGQRRTFAMGCYRARGAANSQTHNPRSMADADLACLLAKFPGSDHRQFGTIFRRLVRGSLLCSGRQLHVADRVAHRNNGSICAPCQRHHLAATRTHQSALERGSSHRRHRP